MTSTGPRPPFSTCRARRGTGARVDDPARSASPAPSFRNPARLGGRQVERDHDHARAAVRAECRAPRGGAVREEALPPGTLERIAGPPRATRCSWSSSSRSFSRTGPEADEMRSRRAFTRCSRRDSTISRRGAVAARVRRRHRQGVRAGRAGGDCGRRKGNRGRRRGNRRSGRLARPQGARSPGTRELPGRRGAIASATSSSATRPTRRFRRSGARCFTSGTPPGSSETPVSGCESSRRSSATTSSSAFRYRRSSGRSPRTTACSPGGRLPGSHRRAPAPSRVTTRRRRSACSPGRPICCRRTSAAARAPPRPRPRAPRGGRACPRGRGARGGDSGRGASRATSTCAGKRSSSERRCGSRSTRRDLRRSSSGWPARRSRSSSASRTRSGSPTRGTS